MKYGSHLPILSKLVDKTDGPILELGVGLYSTPYLHWACFSKKRNLTSYENMASWLKYFRDCRTANHTIDVIEDWKKMDYGDKFYDIAFIDHEPFEERIISAKKLANNAKYIILHDSDPESDHLNHYSEIYPLFKYRYDYHQAKPFTTVLSNLVDLKDLYE